ncbi:unnamed protein product [Thelazia callipaeda]|uniref:Aa_trans domain-containing protein n=1 Tax=Thelazia callipaeda TaxID=103827 RepID=A0A0N5D1G0_THECL|nr:unnamed protein product [Thelazia callipaeda]
MGKSVSDSSVTIKTATQANTGSASHSSDCSRRTLASTATDQEKTLVQSQDNSEQFLNSEFAVQHGPGYNWLIAAIIIVADMVGGGLVAMPAGFHDTGFICKASAASSFGFCSK